MIKITKPYFIIDGILHPTQVYTEFSLESFLDKHKESEVYVYTVENIKFVNPETFIIEQRTLIRAIIKK